MPTNEDIANRIIAALQEKVGNRQIVCPICANQKWSINMRYAVLPASQAPNQITLGKDALPFIPLTCSNCGNTHLINILTLGFKKEDLASLKFSTEENVESLKLSKKDV